MNAGWPSFSLARVAPKNAVSTKMIVHSETCFQELLPETLLIFFAGQGPSGKTISRKFQALLF